MRLLLIASIAVPAAAQLPPVRIVRGEIIDWRVRGPVGDFAVRGADSGVERCRVIPETFITRQTLRVSPTGVRVGDSVEVIADARNGEDRCDALTIYVRPLSSPMVMALAVTAFPYMWPFGATGFAGVVSAIGPGHLVIRTRNQALRSFKLHGDTAFANAGKLVDPRTLEVYTRVWVRATRSSRTLLTRFRVFHCRSRS